MEVGMDKNWNEIITSLVGISPIILKKGGETLCKELEEFLDYDDYPLMGELHQLIETKYAKSEAKHKRIEDIVAHQLYANSLHDLVIRTGVKTIVELGILAGVSSSAFLRALSKRKEGHVWSFDPNTSEIKWWWIPPDWKDYWNYYTMLGEVGYDHYGHQIGMIDMLYIDTAHTYEDTVKFLSNYWINSVRKGGYIVVDDMTPNFATEVDRSKIPPGYWADAADYGILRPVMEFLERRDEDIEFAFVMNPIYSSGVGVIKLKD
jgi:predicted O-methyltransferase YrrM